MMRALSRLAGKRRAWAAGLILAVVLVAALPGTASATCWGLLPCVEDLVGGLAYVFIWLVALVAGVIIAILSWMLDIVLQISFGLVNSTPVRTGFPIVLSIANLFFVGALIAIAIATIIRQAQYGAKSVLWKLVTMSIMVNFGLVICGTLLSISDQMTVYFIESISPVNRDEGGVRNFTGFASAMAGAFNPRAMIISQEDVSVNPALSQQSLAGINGTSASKELGSSIGGIIRPLVAVMAALGSFIIIIITLTTFILMLLWRYIRLGMALIVLPLAWASWIFPSYQEHYKKWWTKFTQWAIFPPVVVFFIWLGLKISEVMNAQDAEFADIYRRGPNGNPVSDFLGGLFAPVISQTLQAFILFGIMMGGMVAAQELGVKFADAGYKAIEGAGNGAKNWAKTKAAKWTERPREALKRDAARTMGRFTRAKLRLQQGGWKALEALPRVSKKRVVQPDGSITWEKRAPDELRSAIKEQQADWQRDDLEDRLNPGNSLKQRKGETTAQWQARLQRMGERNEKLKHLRRQHKDAVAEEDEDAWTERFNKGAAELATADPGMRRKRNEDFEVWKARILAANPRLKRKGAQAASDEDASEWAKRLGNEAENLAKKAAAEREKEWQEREESLLASVWKGATEGFYKGAGHKKPNTKEFNKALEALGVHVPHEEHPKAAAGGGGGGGDGGHPHP